jgi:ketosteroid isomerase-like protein
MKGRLVAMLLLSAYPILAHCQDVKSPPSKGSSSKSSKIASEVKEVIRQRHDALRRGDVKTYLSYFADDCIITDDDGSVTHTPQSIAKTWGDDHRYGIAYQGGELTEFAVRASGVTAVARYRVDLDEDWSGQKIYPSYRDTDVLVRRAGRWLLLSHTETPIPYARRLAVKVDRALLDAYTGEYHLTPNYIVKVKREGDQLMEQWPGEKDFSPDLPVSESTFVSRGSLGQVIYVRDQDGKVTHFIFRTESGDVIAQKTK